MPTISRAELDLISAAFKDIRINVEQIAGRAPDVRPLCDEILSTSKPALKILEAIAEQIEDGFPG